MSVSQLFSDHQIYSVDFSFFQLNSFFQIIRKFAKLLMCLVTCNKESRCPCCLVESEDRGEIEEWARQSMVDTLKTLKHR